MRFSRRTNRLQGADVTLLACCVLVMVGCRLPYVPLPRFLSSHDTARKLQTIDGMVLDNESIGVPLQTAAPDGEQDKTPPTKEEDQSQQKDESTGDAQPETTPVPAPDRLELTLGDARASALNANLDVAVQLINPAIARTVISQESSRFEATFNGSYTSNRIDPPPGFALGGNPDTTVDRLDNSITQPLISGGQIRVLHNATNSDIHLPGVPNAVDTDVGLELRQPLLRGAGFQVSTAGIHIAQVTSGIADAQSKLTAVRVLAEVERAYWQLYAAIRILDIAQRQLGLAEKQFVAAKRLVQAEVLIKVDQSRAETGVLARRSAAISAETDVRIAERELKRIMQLANIPVDSATRLTLATEPEPIGLVFDRRNLATRGVENRMEMLQLQLQVLVHSIQVNLQRNSLMPRLDLVAELDALGLEKSYQRSMEVLSTGDFSDRLFGLAVEVPLSGNVAARARLREAQLRRMQTLVQQKRVAVLITQEVYNAIDRIEQNWLRILATRQASKAAQDTFDGESRLYQAGRQPSNFVLIALTNLSDAQSQEVLALTDYQIAKVDLALATGTMLGFGQVYWNPCQGAQSPLPESP